MNGGLAMLFSSRRSTPVFRTIEVVRLGRRADPVVSRPAGILHSDAYCMTKASENKDAAWSFMEFALRGRPADRSRRPHRAVAEERRHSDAFLDPRAKPQNSRVFLDAIPNIRHVPTVSTWPEIEDAAASSSRGCTRASRSRGGGRAAIEATTPMFARVGELTDRRRHLLLAP